MSDQNLRQEGEPYCCRPNQRTGETCPLRPVIQISWHPYTADDYTHSCSLHIMDLLPEDLHATVGPIE